MTSANCPSCKDAIEIDENERVEWECPKCAARFQVNQLEGGKLQFHITAPTPKSAGIQAELPNDVLPRRKERPTTDAPEEEADLNVALSWGARLQLRFPDMQPGKPPPLFSVNGCGIMMYGSRDFDEDTGAYVKSACVVILFVPLFVISSYVVNDAQYAGWHILGRVPLSSFARAWNVVVALLLCMAIFACVLSRF